MAFDRIRRALGRTPTAEPDITPDPARANSRSTGGVDDPGAADQASTTGSTPSGEYVGRVAGQDIGAVEEQGAERRAAADD